MTTHSKLRSSLFALLMGAVLSVGGCDFLEVDNPNDLVEEDLNNPSAASPMANGAEASLTRAMIDIIGPYTVAGDEAKWIGSREPWGQIERGVFNAPLNEWNNRVYEFLAEARWTADEYIRRLEDFRENDQLTSNRPLIRVYMYAAILRINIADKYDNFVFSDRQDPGKPIGEENMSRLYDTAVQHVNSALDLSPKDDLRKVLLGLRAQAKFNQGIWEKVNPPGDVNVENPLVNRPEAASDAEQALNLMEEDFRFQLILQPDLDLVPFDQAFADHLNQRRELDFGDEIGERVDAETFNVTLEDPIDNVPAPFLQERINEFIASDEFADHTVVSAREMHLIQAEVALSQGNTDAFQTHINAIRTLDGLSEYTGQISEREMLQHARRVNLFLQKRRLADMYRFGIKSPTWTDRSPAIEQPGTFFSIPQVERQANPNL